MKKLLIICLALGCLLSCSDDKDPVFKESPEQRIAKVLAQYKAQLVKGDGYWITYYYGNAILMKFDKDNRVAIKSNFANGKYDNTITYRVSSTQVPELTFENYSVFQAIYEQHRNEGEYEFLFSKLDDAKIDFVSKTDVGSKKTELSFFKATPKELETVIQNTKDIDLMSVFKQVVVEGSGSYLASIDMNSDKTAVLKKKQGGEIVTTTHEYVITSKGLRFTPSLKINKDKEVAEFVYDKANSRFDSKEGVAIIEKKEPVLPLAPYKFGAKVGLRYNYIEPGKVSGAFLNFYNNYLEKEAALGLTIKKFYIRTPKGGIPYLHIYTNIGKVYYTLSYEVKEDGKVYFSLEGRTNAGKLHAHFKPLVDKIVNTKGHFIENTGGLLRYTNRTVSLINADNPSFKINFYDF